MRHNNIIIHRSNKASSCIRWASEGNSNNNFKRCWRWLGKQQNFINNISFSATLSRMFSSMCLVFRGSFGRTDRLLDRFWKFNSLLVYFFVLSSLSLYFDDKTWIVVSSCVFFCVVSIRHAFPCKFLSKLTLYRCFVFFFIAFSYCAIERNCQRLISNYKINSVCLNVVLNLGMASWSNQRN